MKTILRSIVWLALIVWLGAEAFFPFVAAVTFTTLIPDTHTAGTIVGALLRILHSIGLVAGITALIVLAVGPLFHSFRPRAVLASMALLVIMIGLTAYSQYGIISAMERDRIAAGGTINTTNAADPNTADFNRLHNRSENVEGAILLLGVATVVLVVWAETGSERTKEQGKNRKRTG